MYKKTRGEKKTEKLLGGRHICFIFLFFLHVQAMIIIIQELFFKGKGQFVNFIRNIDRATI